MLQIMPKACSEGLLEWRVALSQHITTFGSRKKNLPPYLLIEVEKSRHLAVGRDSLRSNIFITYYKLEEGLAVLSPFGGGAGGRRLFQHQQIFFFCY